MIIVKIEKIVINNNEVNIKIYTDANSNVMP